MLPWAAGCGGTWALRPNAAVASHWQVACRCPLQAVQGSGRRHRHSRRTWPTMPLIISMCVTRNSDACGSSSVARKAFMEWPCSTARAPRSSNACQRQGGGVAKAVSKCAGWRDASCNDLGEKRALSGQHWHAAHASTILRHATPAHQLKLLDSDAAMQDQPQH